MLCSLGCMRTPESIASFCSSFTYTETLHFPYTPSGTVAFRLRCGDYSGLLVRTLNPLTRLFNGANVLCPKALKHGRGCHILCWKQLKNGTILSLKNLFCGKAERSLAPFGVHWRITSSPESGSLASFCAKFVTLLSTCSLQFFPKMRATGISLCLIAEGGNTLLTVLLG